MENYRVLSAVEEYIEEKLFEPAANWPRYYFKKRSYERYAAYKILGMVAGSNGIPALRIVEDFIALVRKHPHRENESDMIFNVLEDVATDIYDILRAMQ